MRKLWCAGAIASGVLLFTGVPAQAEDAEPVPGSPGALSTALGYAFDPTNDWRLGTPLASDPLSGQPMGASPLFPLEPGRDRALLQLGQRNDAVRSGIVRNSVAPESTSPASKPKNGKGGTAGKSTKRPIVPAADVLRTMPNAAKAPTGALGGLPVYAMPMPLAGPNMHVANLPVDGLVGRLSGLTATGQPAGGLTPSGFAPAGFAPVALTPAVLPPAGQKGTRTPSPDERPIAPRLERQSSEYPLLGGLAGALPVITRHVADVQDEYSGMPIGGSPLWAARSARPGPDDDSSPAATPTPDAPAPGTPAPDAPAPDASAPDSSSPTVSSSTTADPADADSTSTSDATSPRPGGTSTDGTGTDSTGPDATPSGSGTPSAPAGFAGAERPKSATGTIDDPRLLEEPVDGFVTRSKQ